MDVLGVFERRIRLGHAYDLLSTLKLSLNHQGAFLVDKQKHARGQKDNTRAQKQVNDAVARTRRVAELYNYNCGRLQALSGGDVVDLPSSIDYSKDLKCNNYRTPRQQGDSHDTPSWIWSAVPPWTSGTDAEMWQLEG